MNVENSSTLSKEWKDFTTRIPATIAVETSILLLIALIAIGGNLLVVISIYCNPSLRTITNYFVLSLSLANILHPILGIPPSIFWSIQSRFTSQQGVCDFQASFFTSFIYVSVVTIILMAVNRFVCVCKHDKYKKIFNKKTSLLMLGSVWVISFAGVPLYNEAGLNQTKASFIPSQLRCGFLINKETTSKILVNFIIAMTLLMPFTIITYCYYKVFKKIREHKRNITPASNLNSLGAHVQDINVTWTMFAVLIGYFMTWMPVLIITLLKNIFGSANLPRQVHMIVTYTGSMSTAVNPIIYGVMNASFRQEYKRIFRCT
ncbi:melatonin receptor type 1A-like [Actinia tenebrosa]|uniref:Melatonin receptor type 1A-like n=1 Tax=Actinia tenebrosa TaxID=6105 RepID=A0A6P8H8Y2_ACTTE|nr:melatonin receptor type 1A-like [Actinia tenebrosa]